MLSNPLQFAFEFGKTPARPRDPQQPMRILVLGDFGGGKAATAVSLAQRKFLRVDIDNFEDLLAKRRPTATVSLGGHSNTNVEIEFGELDDFHPDHLIRTLPVFRELRELRKRLLDPATFDDAAAKLREALPSAQVESDRQSADQTSEPAADESDVDTLQRLLGKTAGLNDSSVEVSSGLNIRGLIDEIVAPHIVPGPNPRQDEYVSSVDAAIAAQLRMILHHESFQALQSIWCGLHFLVSNVETSEELQIFFWDVTKSELTEAVESETGRLEDSLLFQRLITEREEQPWSVLATDLSFGRGQSDLTLLSGLGAIAAHSGSPLLASASPGLFGCSTWTEELRLNDVVEGADADAQNWESLRTSPIASWIGLAAPRFLLRLPYGSATDSIDTFPFEEIEDLRADHDAYLWGAPSLLCATLIATSFLENGWAMSPGDHLEVSDLPAVTYQIDGESQLKPCAEVYLPERAATLLLDRGVMPLLSFKNRNAVRLMRFQSIAQPPLPLSGSWS